MNVSAVSVESVVLGVIATFTFECFLGDGVELERGIYAWYELWVMINA